MEKRKIGDTVKISGAYQYKALREGNAVQRFWHYSKQLAINRLLPPNSHETVLDVGCGSGVISFFLSKYGAHVIGIDGNPDAVRFATDNFSKSNTKFVVALIDDKIEFEKMFDKIYCLELIEHIYINQAEIMLKTLFNNLKQGGKILLTTPNYKSFWPLIEWLMDKFQLSPPLTHQQHVEFYNKEKLEKLCTNIGFQIENIATNCLVAPWIAPLSWKLAEKLNDIELRLPLKFGSILIFLLKKP
jgi:2-polyprenyl-3-methyl-5-hydroxy-6-metoxy-1,4-benzoquinol methylase